MQELISVIVPVYNTAQYLPRCVDSIIEQTYKNLEIILVDDGSTDSSGEICDEYAQKDARIKVIHKENGGLGDARNTGLNVANGNYIAFVDSDDEIDCNMYQSMQKEMAENDCEICVCGRYDVFSDAKIATFTQPSPVKMTSKEAIKRLLTYDAFDSSACDKLIKRETIGELRFPGGKHCSEDVGVMYLIIERANGILHCGKPYYHYWHRENSITTSRFSENSMGVRTNHKKVCDFVIEKYPELTKEAEYFYYSRLIYLYLLMHQSGYKGEHKIEVFDELSANLRKIIKNDCYRKREKAYAVLITFKMSFLVLIIKKIREYFKRLK